MHYDLDDLTWEKVDNNYSRVKIHLGQGDTAWHPASTKRVIYGPATVTYERSPNQIVAYVED